MALVRYIIYVILFLAVFVAFSVFYNRNDSVANIDFVFFQVDGLGVGFWVLLSFIAGSVLGWLITLPGWVGLKVSQKRQSQRLKTQQEEVFRLKGDSGK